MLVLHIVMEDRLYKFARLVEAQSFTQAAAQLHISQPALTSAVKKLERELHAELIMRTSRRFRLTAAGELAYKTAKELEARAKNLKLELLEAAGAHVPLSLGMIDSLADLLFVHGHYLQELEDNTRLSLTINNSGELAKLVSRGELDMALLGEPARLPKDLHAETVAEEPLVLVTSRANQTATTAQLHKKRLKHFLAYNHNSQTFRLVERHFSSHDVKLEPIFYSTSPEIMLQLVRSSHQGVAVLPYLLVKPHLKSRELTVINVGSRIYLTRRIVSLNRSGHIIPVAAARILQATQKELRVLLNEADSL